MNIVNHTKQLITSIGIFIASIALLVSACSPQNPRLETIETQEGEKFYIELPSQPTSGKKWYWTNKSEVTLVDSVGFIQEVTQTRTGDEAGIELWDFEAIKTGQETVILEFKKSRTSDASQKRIYTINIRQN